jgi:glucose uptake protein GlcU
MASVSSNRVLGFGIAVLVVGLFGVLAQSELPDWVAAVVGFAVAVVALLLGMRLRRDE